MAAGCRSAETREINDLDGHLLRRLRGGLCCATAAAHAAAAAVHLRWRLRGRNAVVAGAAAETSAPIENAARASVRSEHSTHSREASSSSEKLVFIELQIIIISSQ